MLVIRHRSASFTCCCNHLKTGSTSVTLAELGQRGNGLVKLGQPVIELQWYLSHSCLYERVTGSNQTFETGDGKQLRDHVTSVAVVRSDRKLLLRPIYYHVNC